MITPAWALTLTYWLHMLATVIWIGALAAFSLLVLPAAGRALSGESYAALLDQLQRRLEPLAWFCLALLIATGLIQMSANPNYHGFLAITNRWAVAILLKHSVFAIMVAVSAYLTWGVLPDLRRMSLRLAQGLEAPQAAALQTRRTRLLQLNLALAVVVLGLTAVARAA